MKKFWMTFMLVGALIFGAASLNAIMAQYDYEYETVAPDTISIDDADPILFSEENFTVTQEKSRTTTYIVVVALAIVAGFVIYRVTSKKK
jgi:hypothetical protein